MSRARIESAIALASRHLARKGYELHVETRPVVKGVVIDEFERERGFPVPDGLRWFYTRYSDGLNLWFAARGSLDGEGPEFAPFSAIADDDGIRERVETWWTPEMMGESFPGHTEEADALCRRMMHWIPILDEGNGDQLCVDASVPEGPIVSHQHDWTVGRERPDNGFVVAAGILELLEDWSRVCFSNPRSLGWKAFKEAGRLEWTGEYFEDRFVVR